MSAPREEIGVDEALTEVGRIFAILARSQFDLQQLLQTVIETAVRLCRADSGNIARQDGEVYRIVAYTGLISQPYRELVAQRAYVPERASIIGRALLERRPVHIDDVLADPDYALLDAQRLGQYRTLLGGPPSP